MMFSNGIYPVFPLSVPSKLPCLSYVFKLSPGMLEKETVDKSDRIPDQ